MKYLSAVVATLIITVAPAAWAHGDAKKPHAAKKAISTEEKTFGREGDPGKATRTVNVDMSDKMRFTPDSLTLKQGETVKFVVKNSGKIMHEFVLGTMSELKEHSALMKKFPGMEHSEPYMAHVAPGKTETIAWQFTKAGNFNFGCLIPGHFEAGMVGNVAVK
ncbi:MAG: cupredoxin family protein [Burkholderiales bacterium]|jgi:uncharacterized cupredoxin-like copper-binding protein|nr:cupredoxin family protein [Burkholderiales bacterium]